MSETILLARLAGRRIAFPAPRLESIVEIDRITPVPRAPHYIEGLSTLRSQSLTVINCLRVLGIDEGESEPAEVRHAAVIKHGGHHYALVLDDVEDVVEWHGDVEPVLGGVGEEWEKVAVGVVETEAGPALLLDVEPFVEVELEPAQ